MPAKLPSSLDPPAKSTAALRAFGQYEGTKFDLASACTTIGRRHDCDICLSHASVGRLHANVIFKGGGYYLSHQGSIAITKLNGHDVRDQEMRLAPGDMIHVGTGGDRFEFIDGKGGA